MSCRFLCVCCWPSSMFCVLSCELCPHIFVYVRSIGFHVGSLCSYTFFYMLSDACGRLVQVFHKWLHVLYRLLYVYTFPNGLHTCTMCIDMFALHVVTLSFARVLRKSNSRIDETNICNGKPNGLAKSYLCSIMGIEAEH